MTEAIFKHIIEDISSAKEQILCELIEKIEGRPAVSTDAKNLIIAIYSPNLKNSRERIIYKNIQLGDIEVDTEQMVVRFIPIVD